MRCSHVLAMRVCVCVGTRIHVCIFSAAHISVYFVCSPIRSPNRQHIHAGECACMRVVRAIASIIFAVCMRSSNGSRAGLGAERGGLGVLGPMPRHGPAGPGCVLRFGVFGVRVEYTRPTTHCRRRRRGRALMRASALRAIVRARSINDKRPVFGAARCDRCSAPRLCVCVRARARDDTRTNIYR